MKSILLLLACLTFTASAAEPAGRYQLIAAPVLTSISGKGEALPYLFRIDTMTGEVWQLVAVKPLEQGGEVWQNITPPTAHTNTLAQIPRK